jgi:hypothetical protein
MHVRSVRQAGQQGRDEHATRNQPVTFHGLPMAPALYQMACERERKLCAVRPGKQTRAQARRLECLGRAAFVEQAASPNARHVLRFANGQVSPASSDDLDGVSRGDQAAHAFAHEHAGAVAVRPRVRRGDDADHDVGGLGMTTDRGPSSRR